MEEGNCHGNLRVYQFDSSYELMAMELQGESYYVAINQDIF